MSGLIDMTGQRCGRLLVIGRAENDHKRQATWKCRCDCGREVIVSGHHLRHGKTRSCGCYNHEPKTTIHGASRTRLYHIWCAMKQRCYDQHHKGYEYYGGRGITVCSEWLHDFSAFQDWAYLHGYREYLTIDRIDNDKGYSPNNCRWVTYFEQNRNQRPRKEKGPFSIGSAEQAKGGNQGLPDTDSTSTIHENGGNVK